MECNKDDAVKAKEIAERKFKDKDMAGAKKFALKAQNLYPALEGISQMLTTLDVYASSENQFFGEADWYAVLGVSPQADEDTIRKHYRKLALMLHPDKNKSIGSEGAFKIISEAWSSLSDRSRRALYDAKRNARVSQQKAKPFSESSFTPRANGFYNFGKPTTSSAKANKESSHKNSSTSASGNKSSCDTFWTLCHKCMMRYEYLRSYLNRNLICPGCQQSFFAIETPPPVSGGSKSSRPWISAQYGQNSHQEIKSKSKSKRSAGHNSGDFQWVPFSAAAGASSVAQAANVVQQTYEKVRKVREEEQAARKREKMMKRKNYTSEEMVNSHIEKKRRVKDEIGIFNNQMAHGTGGYGIPNSLPPRHGDSGSLHAIKTSKVNNTREQSEVDLCNILIDKARKGISKKLTEWKSASVLDFAVQKSKALKKVCRQDSRKEGSEVDSNLHDPGSRKMENVGIRTEVNSSQSANSAAAKEMMDQLSVPVPDPDFHEFDKDRTERAFEENQVWAVYDNDDGMPRYYVLIHSVISRDPFRLKISWLNPKRNTGLGPLNLFSFGLTITCGDFSVGRCETYDSLNCFSHKVSCMSSTGGTIRIFPRKGDVWALYRHWSPDWHELMRYDVMHEFDMVKVLEDYDEKLGGVVIPLVKVAGFKGVFHQHLDPKQVRRIPKDEVFRFSHQVPSYLLSGLEAPNALKGCLELDPAALPVEFLQVINDGTEDFMEIQANKQELPIPDDRCQKISWKEREQSLRMQKDLS